MADIQIDDGNFTRIANRILENIIKAKLSGIQFAVVITVWRYTYGFQKKEADLSLTFLSNAIGCDKRQLQRELKNLENRKIIAQKITMGKTRVIAFNKNYEEWAKNSIGEIPNGETPNGEVARGTIGESTEGTIGESTNQKRNKENIKERDYKSIFDYYLTLKLIKHRTYTKDMARAIKRAMSDNKYDAEYCRTLLDRHKRVVELSAKTEYQVKARGFAEFFGQKVFGGSHLICAEYEEGGKYYEMYLKVEEEQHKPTGGKLIILERE